jgi:hypothetical protein
MAGGDHAPVLRSGVIGRQQNRILKECIYRYLIQELAEHWETEPMVARHQGEPVTGSKTITFIVPIE